MCVWNSNHITQVYEFAVLGLFFCNTAAKLEID